MIDRGATMTVKNHMTIQNYLNIKSPSNMVDVIIKNLDNHGYDKFIKNKADNTTQDTFVYTKLTNT